MKYRLISLITVVLMIAIAVAAQDFQPAENRYHQHREAVKYTPCTTHGDEQFCTHLPLFNIVTDEPIPEPFFYDETGEILLDEEGRKAFNDEMVAASVEFFTNSDGNNHLTDEPDVSERGLVRIRGNSSRRFEKKSYLLKFTQENGIDGLDVSLDGMASDSTWVLHGPILDKTLLRNYLCYNITGEVMDYVPEVRFCELCLNGEYQGVYVLTEKIKYNEDGRCSITKTDPDLKETSFILLMDKGCTDADCGLRTFFDDAGMRGLSNRPNEYFEITYPGDTLTQAQKEYITSEISHAERAMSCYDLADAKLGYSAYLDVDSFVNFYVFNQFMMNWDAGHLSTYFCKDIRGKITIIGWDYNNTFDNYIRKLSEEEFYYMNEWYVWLLRDRRFVEQVVERYRDLRKTILSDDYLENYITEAIEYLGPAIDRNYERWGHTFTMEYNQQQRKDNVLLPLERNPASYDEAIAQLMDTIKSRGSFLDNNIETLYGYCHKSVNKQFEYQGGK